MNKKNLKSRTRAIFRFFKQSGRDPESMSRGVGLGIFVGFLPSIGFQIILAVFLAGIFSGNRIAAAIGTLVTNPITSLPVSAFSLWLGDLILPGNKIKGLSIADFSMDLIMNSPGQVGIAFLVGCLALAVIGGALGYSSMRIFYSRRQSPLMERNTIN